MRRALSLSLILILFLYMCYLSLSLSYISLYIQVGFAQAAALACFSAERWGTGRESRTDPRPTQGEEHGENHGPSTNANKQGRLATLTPILCFYAHNFQKINQISQIASKSNKNRLKSVLRTTRRGTPSWEGPQAAAESPWTSILGAFWMLFGVQKSIPEGIIF